MRLRPRLVGRVVARYRVISEDGHPVAKRTAFRVKAPPQQRDEPMESPGAAEGAGGAPMPPAEEDHAASGQVTEAAFAVVRGTGYLAIAAATGALVFLLFVWLPAVARWAEARAAWRGVSQGFVGRARRILVGAVLVGLLSTVLAIVLEGAVAAGVSFWAAFDRDVMETVSETRVVRAWGARFGRGARGSSCGSSSGR